MFIIRPYSVSLCKVSQQLDFHYSPLCVPHVPIEMLHFFNFHFAQNIYITLLRLFHIMFFILG